MVGALSRGRKTSRSTIPGARQSGLPLGGSLREKHDTVIVGGGQAGLAMSYHLRQRGREHIILERRRVAERWRMERWDSLRFQLPNAWLALPGKSYSGTDPNGFTHHPESCASSSTMRRRLRPWSALAFETR